MMTPSRPGRQNSLKRGEAADKLCIPCIVRPLHPSKACTCGAWDKPPVTAKDKPKLDIQVYRKGWDQITYLGRRAYLHMDSNTVIVQMIDGWLWRSKFCPETGYRIPIHGRNPEEVMILAEEMLTR